MPANSEPAVAVLRMARESLRQGIPGLNSREAMQQVLDYFCTRRTCKRSLPETLTVRDFAPPGALVVNPWQEPADAIEGHLLEYMSREGTQSSVTLAQASDVLRQLCDQTVCFRGSLRIPERPVELNIEGIGQVTVGAMQEPADAVEAFALAAASAGVQFGFNEMKKVMEYFCARRTCSRLEINPPPPRLSLDVEGIGKITVQPNQDPADMVEEFTRQARGAGLEISGDDMIKILTYFCKQRTCARKELNAEVGKTTGSGTLELQIPGVGSMKCLENQEPADVVEEFTRQAIEAGAKIEGADMIKMLSYFCERRNCLRRELNPVAAGIAGPSEGP